MCILCFIIIITHATLTHSHKHTQHRGVPAGFNKFEFPALNNNFYGDGIPMSKVCVCVCVCMYIDVCVCMFELIYVEKSTTL